MLRSRVAYFAAECDLQYAGDVRLSPLLGARTIPRRDNHATPHHGQAPPRVEVQGDWERGCAWLHSAQVLAASDIPSGVHRRQGGMMCRADHDGCV
jgi:hypothetical protein